VTVRTVSIVENLCAIIVHQRPTHKATSGCTREHWPRRRRYPLRTGSQTGPRVSA